MCWFPLSVLLQTLGMARHPQRLSEAKLFTVQDVAGLSDCKGGEFPEKSITSVMNGLCHPVLFSWGRALHEEALLWFLFLFFFLYSLFFYLGNPQETDQPPGMYLGRFARCKLWNVLKEHTYFSKVDSELMVLRVSVQVFPIYVIIFYCFCKSNGPGVLDQW